jgi:hypothetical protein
MLYLIPCNARIQCGPSSEGGSTGLDSCCRTKPVGLVANKYMVGSIANHFLIMLTCPNVKTTPTTLSTSLSDGNCTWFCKIVVMSG